jgi:hypothetical protein
LERGSCHTLWHRLDLDLVLDNRPSDACQTTQVDDDTVVKLLWLAIRDIQDKRARERAKEASRPRNERKAPPKLVEGATVQGWNAAYGALSLAFPGRLEVRL